jgi:hypothetical protein
LEHAIFTHTQNQKWSLRRDSNPGSSAYKADALTD